MKSVLGLLVAVLVAQTSPSLQTRSEVNTPPYTGAGSFTLSADGRNIVFLARKGQGNELWLHSMDSGVARALPGTDDVSAPSPCLSPDGKSIAYFGGNSLKRFDLETGVIQSIVAVGAGRGCTWNREGTILFGINAQRTILRTTDRPGAGVEPAIPLGTVVTTFPRFLPDGRHFTYFAAGEGIYVAELGGGPPKHLFESDSAAVFSSTGHILYSRQQTLYARQFDPETLLLSGEPIAVTTPIGMSIYDTAVSVSANGILAFRDMKGSVAPQFTWFDRTGKAIETVGQPLPRAGSPASLSSDGRWLVMDRAENGNTDIWLMEVSTGELSKLTEPPGMHIYPVFSNDARTVYLSSNKTGVWETYERMAGVPGEERLVMNKAINMQPRAISSDDRFLLCRAGANIVAVQLDGNPRGVLPPVVEVSGRGLADWPQFSPDDRWIVYASTESGRSEIYVQQFPSGKATQVSKDGGSSPRWAGKEIFYVAPNGQLIAVTVEVGADAEQPRIGESRPLPINNLTSSFNLGPQYMVSADGNRILVHAGSQVVSPIAMIRNWKP
jgi:Tol biopolymer transport system component